MAWIIRQVRPYGLWQLADNSGAVVFEAQATHRTRAHLWSAVSAILVLALGGFYGFLMLVVVSFYGLLILGLFPKWITAPLAAAGTGDNLPPGWFLCAAGILLAAGVALLIRSALGAAPFGAIECRGTATGQSF